MNDTVQEPASRSGRSSEPVITAQQRPALEPVQAAEDKNDQYRWTRWLVWFLRAMAVISMAKGLYHWSVVLGIGEGPDSTFHHPVGAVADRDGLFRDHRSGGGGRALARRGLGRGGVAHRRRFDGGGRGVLSADLWRLVDRGRDRTVSARAAILCSRCNRRASIRIDERNEETRAQGSNGRIEWRRLLSSDSAIWACRWRRTWSRPGMR